MITHMTDLAACKICGKHGVQTRHMTRSFGEGVTLLVIENVPVLVCLHCGKSYEVRSKLMKCLKTGQQDSA